MEGIWTLQEIPTLTIRMTTDSPTQTIQGHREYRIVLAASWDRAERLFYPHEWWTGRLAKARMIGPRSISANP